MKKISIVIIFLVCYAGTCKKNPFVERFYSIKVKNNWTDTIKFSIGSLYPDTSIPSVMPRLKLVYPNDYSYYDSRKSYQEVFKELPADTLSIYFFSVDTLAKYNWQEIRDGYKILKRLDLSLPDLENLNYTVTYP
jgi:hypothetical protein